MKITGVCDKCGEVKTIDYFMGRDVCKKCYEELNDYYEEEG